METRTGGGHSHNGVPKEHWSKLVPQQCDLKTGLPPVNKPIFLSRVKSICFCPHCPEDRPLPPQPGVGVKVPWETSLRVRGTGLGIGQLESRGIGRSYLKAAPAGVGGMAKVSARRRGWA